MLYSKAFILFLGFSALILVSCGNLKTEFRNEETYDPLFYSAVLNDSCLINTTSKNNVPDRIKQITVYKTSFREKLVETGNIINYASLNDQSTRDVVDYRPPRTGYRQDLYLVHVNAYCHSDEWFYYSVWYRYDGKKARVVPYGFGRAYRGTGHNAAGTITFNTNLIVKEQGNNFQLIPKSKAQFYFVFNDLKSDTLKVNRIVVEEKNKFGGPRAYIFKVADHFPGDMQTINFVRINDHSF